MMSTVQNNMKYRFLGNSGLYVSVLSFGSWVSFDTQLDFEKAYSIMARAYDHGINFFDNAEVYAYGKSEEIMGQVIKAGIERKKWEREDLVISTKIFWGVKDGPNAKGCSRKHIIEGTKASLKRFDQEYVDLVFCHRPDPYTPMEEIVRAMNFVINQGWAFYWGTSEWPAYLIEEAHEVAKRLGLIAPIMDQPQYNILERSKVDYDYQQLYKRYKLGLTIWSPLASGVLTGKYSGGVIPEGSRLSLPEYSWLKALALKKAEKADKLLPIAKKLGCTMAQLSIAWCAANPNVSTTILGATSVEQLDENLSAMEFVPKITDEIRKEIDEAVQYQPTLPVDVDDGVKQLRNKWHI